MAEGQGRKRRFAQISPDEIEKKRKNIRPANTVRSNTYGVRQFQAYLSEVGEEKDILELSIEELDGYLANFWFCIRKVLIHLSSSHVYCRRNLHANLHNIPSLA